MLVTAAMFEYLASVHEISPDLLYHQLQMILYLILVSGLQKKSLPSK